MVIEVTKFQPVIKEVIVDISPVKVLFLVKFKYGDGTEDLKEIWSDTTDGYIDLHDFADYEIVKYFIYTLNANLEGSMFVPNYRGKRFN